MRHHISKRYKDWTGVRVLLAAFLILMPVTSVSVVAQQSGGVGHTLDHDEKVLSGSNVEAIAVRPEGNCFIGGSSNHSGGVPVSGGTFSFQILDYETCGWTASGPAWMTLGRTQGVGDATVEYTVQANPGAPRRGVIFVSGNGSSSLALTVYQFGGGLLDFDGDARADISVFRPSDGNWYLQRSRDGFAAVNWGVATDRIVPADYDSDGKTDIAVYRPSTGKWYVLKSSDATYSETQFGIAEDIPAAADFDGDSRPDLIVYRPSTGTWWVWPTYLPGWRQVQFGAAEDIPAVGDYNGDGRAELALFRPSNGTWYWPYDLTDPSHHLIAIRFGLSGDLVTPADFDGDGKTDVAVYRPSTGVWYGLSNDVVRVTRFGIDEDIPTAADYDGDGRADISVFRPSSGVWYRLDSGDGLFSAVPFGLSGDRPTPAAQR